MLFWGQRRRLPPRSDPRQRLRKERERYQRSKQRLSKSKKTLPKLKGLISKMEKSKIIKELTKKYLLEIFSKESYGYHRSKWSAEKHSFYKRILVTNTVINGETQNSSWRVKQCPRFITETQEDTSIQREINMMREAAQNTIGHPKDLPNEKNNIFERHKRNLIERIKDVCQTNLSESSHTVEKLRKQIKS